MTASAGPPIRPASLPAAVSAGGGEDGVRCRRPALRRVAGAPTGPGRPRSSAETPVLLTDDQELAVETPSDCSIFATIPVVGSKNFVLTAVQPPNLSMVNSVLGFGKLNVAATDGSTGR